MLLRGVPLRKPLRSRMFNTPRALKGFLILAPHPKSLRQIGNLWFSERTPEVLTNLSWEVRFFAGNGEGIEALAKPIFVRAQPFNGRHAPCLAGAPCARKGRQPLQRERHRRPPSPRIQNGFAGLVALRRARARLPQRGASPLAIGKANAPAPEVSAYGVLYISE